MDYKTRYDRLGSTERPFSISPLAIMSFLLLVSIVINVVQGSALIKLFELL